MGVGGPSEVEVAVKFEGLWQGVGPWVCLEGHWALGREWGGAGGSWWVLAGCLGIQEGGWASGRWARPCGVWVAGGLWAIGSALGASGHRTRP